MSITKSLVCRVRSLFSRLIEETKILNVRMVDDKVSVAITSELL